MRELPVCNKFRGRIQTSCWAAQHSRKSESTDRTRQPGLLLGRGNGSILRDGSQGNDHDDTENHRTRPDH